jgi:uncharacterized CHY-type Zn-finger protein
MNLFAIAGLRGLESRRPFMRRVGEAAVRGVDLDDETRCTHYDTDRDVVAIRFRCCDEFYACIECHDALADHDPQVWARDAFDEAAVLCGVCGTALSIRAYLDADDACPECGAAFNPGCAAHSHHYFAVEGSDDAAT